MAQPSNVLWDTLGDCDLPEWRGADGDTKVFLRRSGDGCYDCIVKTACLSFPARTMIRRPSIKSSG